MLYIARFQVGPLSTIKQYVCIAKILVLWLLPARNLIIVIIPHVRARILRIRRIMARGHAWNFIPHVTKFIFNEFNFVLLNIFQLFSEGYFTLNVKNIQSIHQPFKKYLNLFFNKQCANNNNTMHFIIVSPYYCFYINYYFFHKIILIYK